MNDNLNSLKQMLDLVYTLEKSKGEKSLKENIVNLQNNLIKSISIFIQGDDKLNLQEIQTLQNGEASNKIAAIRDYKNRTGLRLVEAKKDVEDYMMKTFGYTYCPMNQ